MLNRLQRVHARFLESSRSLSEGQGYWAGAGPLRRWIAQLVTPVPLLSLDEGGCQLYDALVWLEANCRAKPLSEDLIRHYHRLLALKGPEAPGEYRRGRMVIERSTHTPPAGPQIPSLMKRLDATMAAEQRRLDAGAEPDDLLRTSVEIHHKLVFIHPFADGNGRVARLAMNHLLRRYGLGYVILPPLHKSPEHFEALESANEGDSTRLHALAKAFRVNDG